MRRAVLTAVGDVFLGDSPVCFGFGVRSSLRRQARSDLVKRVSALLGTADSHIANLECVMSDAGSRRWDLGRREMRGAPDDISLLSAIGWRVLNVANNHAFQHGRVPFEDTVQRLQDVGIAVLGLETTPTSLLMDCGDLSVLFVGYSLRPEQYRPGEDVPYALRHVHGDLVAEIRSLRAGFNGPIVCSLHWGYELMDETSRQQQDLAHELVDAGASLVIGHHPHVLQGFESYNGGLIAYSLGNFVFDILDPLSRETGVLRVDMSTEGVQGYEFVPAMIAEDYFPRAASPAEAARIRERLAKLGGELAAGALRNDVELAAIQRRLYQAYRRKTYRSMLAETRRFNPYFLGLLIIRAFLRRLGVIANP